MLKQYMIFCKFSSIENTKYAIPIPKALIRYQICQPLLMPNIFFQLPNTPQSWLMLCFFFYKYDVWYLFLAYQRLFLFTRRPFIRVTCLLWINSISGVKGNTKGILYRILLVLAGTAQERERKTDDISNTTNDCWE